MRKTIYTTLVRRGTLAMLPFFLFATALRAQVSFANGDFEAWTGNCPINVAPNSWDNYSTTLAGPDQGGTCAGTVTAHGGSSYMNLAWINSGLQEGAVQTVTGLTINTQYRIGFWAINSNGLYANPGDCILQVHQNTISIFSTPNLVAGGAWTYYSVDFTSQALSEPIGFKVFQGTNGTSGSVGVDDFSVTEIVGIQDQVTHPLHVYPVPTKGALYIDQGDYLSGDLLQVPYTVCNMTGQKMQESALSFVNGKAQIDLPSMAAGIYYLNLVVDGKQVAKKFVVE